VIDMQDEQNMRLKKQIDMIMEKIRNFLNVIERELQEHPEYVADPMQITSNCISIVLNRTKNGIKHSLYLEVKLS
jgi:hypothetical protein